MSVTERETRACRMPSGHPVGVLRDCRALYQAGEHGDGEPGPDGETLHVDWIEGLDQRGTRMAWPRELTEEIT